MHFSGVNRATTSIIKPCFSVLQLPAIAEILAENRYNMDKGGVYEGEGFNGIVIGPEGRKVIARKSNGSRVWTSFIECISATGMARPPPIIFKELQGANRAAAVV